MSDAVPLISESKSPFVPVIGEVIVSVGGIMSGKVMVVTDEAATEMLPTPSLAKAYRVLLPLEVKG